MSETLHIGDRVLFYDEDKQPLAATVAHIFDSTPAAHTDRPTCNLAIIQRDGRVGRRISVEPAYHDGTRWHLLEKWALRGEVPDDEWNYLPPPANAKPHMPGMTDHISL